MWRCPKCETLNEDDVCDLCNTKNPYTKKELAYESDGLSKARFGKLRDHIKEPSDEAFSWDDKYGENDKENTDKPEGSIRNVAYNVSSIILYALIVLCSLVPLILPVILIIEYGSSYMELDIYNRLHIGLFIILSVSFFVLLSKNNKCVADTQWLVATIISLIIYTIMSCYVNPFGYIVAVLEALLAITLIVVIAKWFNKIKKYNSK